MKPLVSVVVIFWNSEKYFTEALDSVVTQTYQNWEVLLIDDGSTDGSTEIAQGYVRKYPGKFRYFTHDGHQNRGMSASRNLGFAKAEGELVALLDADDVWYPQKLERQVALAEAHPEVGMFYGRTTIWYGWTGAAADARKDYNTEPHAKLDTVLSPPELLRAYLTKESHSPSTSSVMFRSDVIARTGGYEAAFRDLYEDAVFYAKVFLTTPVYIASDCNERYRQHPESSVYVAIRTGKWHPGKLNHAKLAYLEWVEAYLAKQGIADDALRSALTKALWPYRHPVLYFPTRCARFFERQAKRSARLLARIAP